MNPSQGCGSVNCSDNNACTLDTCAVKAGSAVCNSTALSCDDNNICTTDLCDSASGCYHQNISCELITLIHFQLK